jgi:Putative zinc-finger
MLFNDTTALVIESMDHSEAVEQMTVERYLLDELTPDAREEFEEHLFDCHECAQDLRAATAFVDETKIQLPALTDNLPAPPSAGVGKPKVKRDHWLSWWRPVFAIPAFAALLLVIGYQNLVTLPALSVAASQPRLLPWFPLRGSERGSSHLPVTADREHGVALPIDLSQPQGIDTYTSFTFVLIDPQGRPLWTGSIAAPANGQPISLAIPGAMLRTGAYTVAVSGVEPHGERTPIEQYVFDVLLTD